MPAPPGGTGTPGAPVTTFKVAGSSVDPLSNGIRFRRVTLFSRASSPMLEFDVLGGAMPDPLSTTPDPYLGNKIELYSNEGSDVLIFAGLCESGPAMAYTVQQGWSKSYVVHGWRAVSDHVPYTNPQDGTDAISYNLPPDDPSYVSARAGRTIGYMVRDVLEGTANATALKGYGIGSYGTIPSTAAVAHATVSAGAVTVVVDSGGAGYSSGSPPNCLLVGGGGTYSSATVSVSGGGAVTSVSVSGSTGYTTAPEVWISPLPLTTLADLAAMTTVIPHPVTFQGEKILQAIDAAMRIGAPNHFLHVHPDGTIRFYDQRTFSSTSLTMGTDKVDVEGIQLSRSVADCYPRVVVRGGPDVVPVLVQTSDSSLVEAFGHDGMSSSDAKTYWSLLDFVQPGENSGRAVFTATISSNKVTALTIYSGGWGYAASTTYSLTFSGGGGSGAVATMTTNGSGHVTSTSISNQGSGYTSAPTVTAPAPGSTANRDLGTCTCPNTLTVRITSSDATKSWGSNYWDWSATGRQGTIFLTYSSGSGIDVKFSTRIISHPSLSAAGTCDLTVETPLPATNYDTYEIVGTAGGASEVWRKYTIANSAYSGKLLPRFRRPVAYRWSDGNAATLTSVPVASVQWSSSGSAPYVESPIGIDVDYANGVIRTRKPVVSIYGTVNKLNQGGSSVDGIPTNVKALVAVNRGNLTATKPADSGGMPQYAGTSNTLDGLQRTLTITCPRWIDRSNQTNMDTYAQDVLDSVKDTVVEGSIPILAYASTWFTPGLAAHILGNGYDTLWQDSAIPVVECTLVWTQSAGAKYQTILKVSSRRATYTAEQFLRPTPDGQWVGVQSDGDGIAMGRLDDLEARAEWLFSRIDGLGYDLLANEQDARSLGVQ